MARLATNQWHQRNDFHAAEALVRRAAKPQNDRLGSAYYGLGIYLLGQEKYDAALTEFRRARAAGFTGSGEYYARLFDIRRQPAEADKIYFASAAGRDGWQGETGIVTWIDRGQPTRAADAARAWADKADTENDVLESLRARAGIASVAVLQGQGDADRAMRELLALVDTKGAAGDALYPPISAELRLYAGLLAAYRNDRAGVDEALRRTEGSAAARDYPTVQQLRQVVLAEQERLAGQPQLALARLQPLARQDTALVAVHWALLQAAQSAGNAGLAGEQTNWLATHRGRVFVEYTSSSVLLFFNIAVANKKPQGAANVVP